MNNSFFIESLDENEILFIKKKYDKSSKEYLRIMNFLLILCSIIPLIISLFFWLMTNDIDVFIKALIISFISLITFFILIATIFYFLVIFNKYRDTINNTKIVEKCNIIEKKFIKLNESFHFYLNSIEKYSIEVSKNDYDNFETGDELNIEYTTFDKELLGYY